ncbi:hypothetical protein AOL_s00110g286 [Orbilia oligospora ATCC 24927]|uniref:Uncharacterized protein n=1 Tax=Arthrobotrys oligospora (strain ATCC 24927 / CBS 115.81 / DSM 1491) TaxID=756982 RepID=G1XLB6_ARTOA|nr:hypothetical protein AOL_s00110g286 [Orbilia oligospora ATCC 24927]EGX46122.1 hypothetical protein AOL_s00110g286 [Orbilia oligospora ATCC 24927]
MPLLILLLFVAQVWPHETNIVLTDSLDSVTCKLPAFRFFQNTTLVLNELIPTVTDFSTCSWHDDIISAAEMCGADGIPYQCAIYTDNTCGNGNIEHTNETIHSTIIPDISNVYKIVFSDPDDQWVKASWDGDDRQQTIRSYHCNSSTASEYRAFMKDGANTDTTGTTSTTSTMDTTGGGVDSGASATTEIANGASETATVSPIPLLLNMLSATISLECR